jgi:hypothetical protein
MDTWTGSEVFGFESVAERTLEYIPMSVRMKLDLCGLKPSLGQWSGLRMAVRQILLEEPCGTVVEIRRVREYLQLIVEAHGLGDIPPCRSIAPPGVREAGCLLPSCRRWMGWTWGGPARRPGVV